MVEWYVVRLPKGTEFTHIKKEKDCQGRLILIYEEDGGDACWLSQSMPAIVRAINNTVSRPKRLHCSSAYRILRAESLSHVHKNFHVVAFHRNEIDALNEHIADLPGCRCVTKDPNAWYIKALDSDLESLD
jgi:hypothetical protein